MEGNGRYVKTQEHSLSLLLRLTPEIRELIFEAVLGIALPVPHDPIDKTHRRRLNAFRRSWLETTTWYPVKAVPNVAGSLLLICRQVRREVLGLISRIKQKQNYHSRYELSVTILDDQYLFPTWLLVPPIPLESASLVWTDIREAGLRQGPRCGWNFGNGWIPDLIWGLFNMLNLFLLHGPAFVGEDFSPHDMETESVQHVAYSRLQSRPIRELKVLVLNVITPTEAEMEGKFFYPVDANYPYPDIMNAKDLGGVTHPESILNYLGNHVTSIVMRYETPAEYSQLLYERLRIIKLCLDGRERCLWDLEKKTREEMKVDGAME